MNYITMVVNLHPRNSGCRLRDNGSACNHRERKMRKEQTDATIPFSGVGLTDEDIYEAMKTLPGYIDITPGDFKELSCITCKYSMERFAARCEPETKNALHFLQSFAESSSGQESLGQLS
jgi:hypothetical protein